MPRSAHPNRSVPSIPLIANQSDSVPQFSTLIGPIRFLPRPSASKAMVVCCAGALVFATACGRDLEPVPKPAFAPLQLSLQHLRHLGLDANVNGRPVRVVALYAEAPDYRPVGSPA